MMVLQYELRPAGRPQFLGSLQQRKRKRSAARLTETVHYLAWARNGTHPAVPAATRVSRLSCGVCEVGVGGAELKQSGAEGVVRDSQRWSGFLCGNGVSLLRDAPWWSNPAACRRRRLSGPGGSCSSPCRWSRWASPSRWPGCSWSGGSPSAHQRTKVVVFLCLPYCGPVVNWKLIQGVTCVRPETAGTTWPWAQEEAAIE